MPAGRPTKINQDVINRILALVRVGNYVETAASAAGISKETLYAWLRLGATQQTGLAREFSDALVKAAGEAEAIALTRVASAAGEHWQAAAWMLERKHPDRWGRRDTLRLQKVAEELESKSDTDLLKDLGYDGPDGSDPATVGADGSAEAGSDSADPAIERALG